MHMTDVRICFFITGAGSIRFKSLRSRSCSPNGDFGRSDKHFRVRFHRTLSHPNEDFGRRNKAEIRISKEALFKGVSTRFGPRTIEK
jgi:hypothetical protein